MDVHSRASLSLPVRRVELVEVRTQQPQHGWRLASSMVRKVALRRSQRDFPGREGQVPRVSSSKTPPNQPFVCI